MNSVTEHYYYKHRFCVLLPLVFGSLYICICHTSQLVELLHIKKSILHRVMNKGKIEEELVQHVQYVQYVLDLIRGDERQFGQFYH